MRLRPHIVLALARKDCARLLRNGPALMLLGLLVVIAVLVASSGLVEKPQQQVTQQNATSKTGAASWIVYQAGQYDEWIALLQKRAPKELAIRFVELGELKSPDYPPNICVIEIRDEAYYKGRQQIRRPIHYRYPGSDPQVLWPVTRWFLSVSIEYFGNMPQFFETMEPIAPPTSATQTRASLERVSMADVLSVSLIGTALLTSIQFFAACGLMVSLTAQERERGALRALLLTPATYLEFVASKVLVHGGLALGTCAVVIAALQPATLTSLLFWATMLAMTCGYFALGLLIATIAKNQTAPNLLSFAYLLAIGTLNLLAIRFEAFQVLSALTFERYGLIVTNMTLSAGGLDSVSSLQAMRLPQFRMLVVLSTGLLMIAIAFGSRRLRA